MTKKEQITLLAIKKRQTNTIETVLKRQSKERSKLENKLRNEVIQYFTKLEKQVLTTYKKASSQGIPAHNIQVLIMMLIQSWHEEYTPLLDYYHQLIQKLASNQNQELIHLQQRKTLGLKRSNETLTLNPVLSPEDNPIKLLAVKVQTKLDDLLENEEPKQYIIEENKQITETIKQSNFKFSEKTRQRITKEINEILTHSETEGIGPYQVAEQIQKKFQQLKTYEANRIARTEINRADNTYRYDDIMNNKLIDYIQWHGHDDGKERDSHIKCNGEIIRKGELFSNGLRYPGDPQAPAKEVINCRCTIVPYIPPFDKMVPTGMDSFKEGDLIDKPENAGTQFLLETIENTRIITPAEGGLNVNLDNIRISNVKETLGKLSQQTLDGYLKTKKEVQSTLDKLLGINKKTKPTGINKFKKKLHDNWKQYKPTTLDDIQPLYNLNKSSEPVDIDKFEKKLDDDWKNGEIPSFDKQQTMYDIKAPTTNDLKQPSTVSNLQMNKKEVTTLLIEDTDDIVQPLEQKSFKQVDKHLTTQLEKYLNKVPTRYARKREKIQNQINKINDEIKNIKDRKNQEVNSNLKSLIGTGLNTEEQKIYNKLLKELKENGVDIKELDEEILIEKLEWGIIKRKEFLQLHQKATLLKFPKEIRELSNIIEQLKKDSNIKTDKNLQNYLKRFERQLETKKRVYVKKCIPQEVRAAVERNVDEKYANQIQELKNKKEKLETKIRLTYSKEQEESERIQKNIDMIGPTWAKKAQKEHKRVSEVVPSDTKIFNNKEYKHYNKTSQDEVNYTKHALFEDADYVNHDEISEFYTDDSGAFNKYVNLKRQGASETELNEVIEKEYHKIIWDKENNKFYDNIKQKYEGITSKEELKELFDSMEKAMIDTASPLTENTVTVSVQNMEHFEGLEVGDELPHTGFTSTTLTEQQTENFAKRQHDRGNDIAIIEYYADEDVPVKKILKTAHIDEEDPNKNYTVEREIVHLPGPEYKREIMEKFADELDYGDFAVDATRFRVHVYKE